MIREDELHGLLLVCNIPILIVGIRYKNFVNSSLKYKILAENKKKISTRKIN